MLIACGFCGVDITDGSDCGCGRPRLSPRERSHLLDVVRTAAELGGGCVTETSLAQASRVLAEEPS